MQSILDDNHFKQLTFLPFSVCCQCQPTTVLLSRCLVSSLAYYSKCSPFSSLLGFYSCLYSYSMWNSVFLI